MLVYQRVVDHVDQTCQDVLTSGRNVAGAGGPPASAGAPHPTSQDLQTGRLVTGWPRMGTTRPLITTGLLRHLVNIWFFLRGWFEADFMGVPFCFPHRMAVLPPHSCGPDSNGGDPSVLQQSWFRVGWPSDFLPDILLRCCTRASDEALKWLNASRKLPLDQEPRDKVLGLGTIFDIFDVLPHVLFLRGAKSNSQILGEPRKQGQLRSQHLDRSISSRPEHSGYIWVSPMSAPISIRYIRIYQIYIRYISDIYQIYIRYISDIQWISMVNMVSWDHSFLQVPIVWHFSTVIPQVGVSLWHEERLPAGALPLRGWRHGLKTSGNLLQSHELVEIADKSGPFKTLQDHPWPPLATFQPDLSICQFFQSTQYISGCPQIPQGSAAAVTQVSQVDEAEGMMWAMMAARLRCMAQWTNRGKSMGSMGHLHGLKVWMCLNKTCLKPRER